VELDPAPNALLVATGGVEKACVEALLAVGLATGVLDPRTASETVADILTGEAVGLDNGVSETVDVIFFPGRDPALAGDAEEGEELESSVLVA
jgi:hypothetical protein